jgi:superoxide reductase
MISIITLPGTTLERGNSMAQATMNAGALGSAPSQLEVDFYVVPTRKMKMTAHAYCTKHGLWQSDEVIVEVSE